MENITPEQALAKYEENRKAWIEEKRELLLREFMLDSPLNPYCKVTLAFDGDRDLQYVRTQLALARIWNDLPESIECTGNNTVTVCCKYANVVFGNMECPKAEGVSNILFNLFTCAQKQRVELIEKTAASWENIVTMYLSNPSQPYCVFTSSTFTSSEQSWACISAIEVAKRYAARMFKVEYTPKLLRREEDGAVEQYIDSFTIVLKQ